MKVVYLGKSKRDGKRRDGTSAVYFNADVMVPGVGAGQVGVDEDVFRSLDGVAFGTECDVEFGARLWSGRMEFRPIAFRPSRVKAA